MGPLALATGSQAISSIANFLFVLSLLANLTPVTFGLYSIAFAIVLVGTAVLQGFFQLQMVTTLPKLSLSDTEEFASALFLMQLGATITMVIIAVGLTELIFEQENYWQLVISTGLAIIGLSGKEFLIRYLFAISRITFWIPAINFLAAAVLAVLVISDLPAGGSHEAMLAYALSQIAAMLLAASVSQLRFRPKKFWDPLRTILVNGTWGALSAITYSLRSSAHTFIVGASLSLGDVGQMNAARTLLTPATLMIPSLSAVVLPRLTQARFEGGSQSSNLVALQVASGLSVMVLMYAVFLAMSWPLLVKYVLGDEFIGLGTYVALWFVFAFTISLRNVAEWALQSTQSFRSLLIYNMLAAVLTLLAVIVFTATWGVIGAISGVIIGEAFMVILCTFFRLKWSERRSEN